MSAGPLQKIVLGSRGSELARVQTAMVAQALREGWPELEIEIAIIKTGGDGQSLETAEAIDLRAGRKGLFTSEIERQLVAGRIDIAVHSAKDLPGDQTPGVEVHAVLPRAAVEDLLISKNGGGIVALPDGCVVGTGSVRRRRQLCWRRPDLNIFALRGNVPTRLRKLDEGSWEAIVLARAGIERLGHDWRRGVRVGNHTFYAEVLDKEFFLPAGGQGVIALQVRSEDSKTKRFVERVNDTPTLLCLRAEREFLRLLQGDCGTPVGVLATVTAGVMTLRGQIFEGSTVAPLTAWVEGAEATPELLARRLWEAINGK